MATMTVNGDTAKEMREAGFEVRYPCGERVYYRFSARSQYNVQLADYIVWKNGRKIRQEKLCRLKQR